MIIRRLRKQDLQKGFLETLENLTQAGTISPKKLSAIISATFRNKDYFVFVAEEKGQIIGTASCLLSQRFIHRGGKVAHVEDVAVRKGWQGKGIGSKLMKTVVKEAKKQGCYKAILNCKKELESFNQRFGFKTHKEINMRIYFKQ